MNGMWRKYEHLMSDEAKAINEAHERIRERFYAEREKKQLAAEIRQEVLNGLSADLAKELQKALKSIGL